MPFEAYFDPQYLVTTKIKSVSKVLYVPKAATSYNRTENSGLGLLYKIKYSVGPKNEQKVANWQLFGVKIEMSKNRCFWRCPNLILLGLIL